MASCKASSWLTVDGVYEKKGRDYRYVLELKPDSTFTVLEYHSGVKKTCTGSWVLIDENALKLTCEKGRDIDVVLSSYMTVREIEVKILNSKELNYKGVRVKRK